MRKLNASWVADHLQQLQFAFEHTCGGGLASGFVVLPLILTPPPTFTAAFGCTAITEVFQTVLVLSAADCRQLAEVFGMTVPDLV